jgi:hypothetical protein
MSATRLTLAVLAAVIPTGMASAQQETRTSVDVTGGVGYSNNPFTLAGNDTGAGFVALDVLPRLELTGPQTSLTLSGAARLQQYLRRYSRNDSYSAAADYTVRSNERLKAHARLDLSSAVLGGAESFIPGLIPTGPGAGIGGGVANPGGALPPQDLALYGLRDRRQFGRLGGDVSAAVSARDSVIVSVFAEASRYRRIAFGDYEGYGTSLGYSRQLSDTANVGLRGSGTLYDYTGGSNDTRIVSLEGTTGLKLNSVWSLDGALGVSFVDGGGPLSTSRTSLSGDLNLCSRAARTTMCITAARRVSATGLIGSQYVTTVGGNGSLKLSEREDLSWDSSYSKVGSDGGALVGGRPFANEFLRFATRYDRRLSERLRLTASANIRKLFGANDSRPLDFGGLLGVSVRVGDPR